VNFESGEILYVEKDGWAAKEGICAHKDFISGFVTEPPAQTLIVFSTAGLKTDEQSTVKYQFLSDHGPRPISVCFRRMGGGVPGGGGHGRKRSEASFKKTGRGATIFGKGVRGVGKRAKKLKSFGKKGLKAAAEGLKSPRNAKSDDEDGPSAPAKPAHTPRPFVPQYKTIVLFENQKRRYKKRQGWAESVGKYPLWSDEKGAPRLKDDVNRMCKPPVKGQTRGWQWQNEWALDTTNPNLKAEGWAYDKNWTLLAEGVPRKWKAPTDKGPLHFCFVRFIAFLPLHFLSCVLFCPVAFHFVRYFSFRPFHFVSFRPFHFHFPPFHCISSASPPTEVDADNEICPVRRRDGGCLPGSDVRQRGVCPHEGRVRQKRRAQAVQLDVFHALDQRRACAAHEGQGSGIGRG
jgi:hypothetical protein